MTATQRRWGRRTSGGTTANPAKGLRLERIPGRPLRRTEAGRIALPVRVLRDGEHIGDGSLVLRHEEAEALVEDLARMLGGSVPSGGDGP